MPEEHNRVLTDHASDLLLAPTQEAMNHLQNEGIADRAILVGDVMVDVCLDTWSNSNSLILNELSVEKDKYLLATIHRPDNTDTNERLNEILSLLNQLGHKVLLAAHPRLRAKMQEFGIQPSFSNIDFIPPLGYPDLVTALSNALAVITDSGGLQKEAFLLKTPCVTLRTETEWIETVELGVNLVKEAPSATEITEFIKSSNSISWPTQMPYGEGNASDLVVKSLMEFS
jgi:UDP-N-acetylglucosamine 2-epimerase (non-hydrolysing)